MLVENAMALIEPVVPPSAQPSASPELESKLSSSSASPDQMSESAEQDDSVQETSIPEPMIDVPPCLANMDSVGVRHLMDPLRSQNRNPQLL